MSEITRRQLSRLSTDSASRLKAVAARAGRTTSGEEADPALKPNKPGRADYLRSRRRCRSACSTKSASAACSRAKGPTWRRRSRTSRRVRSPPKTSR